ncbi:MAG: histidine phosphatase family protein [Chitinophagaceae bacterium]|jgi:broad specificity phosphatase PhoE
MKSLQILLVSLIAISFFSCSTAKIFFVRHAEKSLAVKNDPPLTPEGEKRAIELEKILKGKKIKHIYSTQTNRTISTAKPLAESLSLPISYYAHDTMPKFLYRMLESGDNALVVGHSNTVLKMIEELDLRPSKKEIPDAEYDNLFVVYLKSKNGRGGYSLRLKELKFGAPSLSK